MRLIFIAPSPRDSFCRQPQQIPRLHCPYLALPIPDKLSTDFHPHVLLEVVRAHEPIKASRRRVDRLTATPAVQEIGKLDALTGAGARVVMAAQRNALKRDFSGD